MLTVSIYDAQGFSAQEIKKLRQSRQYLEEVVNSLYFKNAVLNHKYLGKFQYANNGGLTNEEIYNLIMTGKEILDPVDDGEMDIRITIYSAFIRGRNVIGYTYPNVNRQWINRRFFERFSAGQIASNLMHEWLHKIGFSHDFNATAQRPYSVPYAVGNMIALEQNQKMFFEHRAE